MPDSTPPKKGGLWARLFAMASENAEDQPSLPEPPRPPEPANAEATPVFVGEVVPVDQPLPEAAAPVEVPVALPVAAPESVPLAKPVNAAFFETPVAGADIEAAPEFPINLEIDNEQLYQELGEAGVIPQAEIIEPADYAPPEAPAVVEEVIPRVCMACGAA